MVITGFQRGLAGFLINRIPASSGVRPLLRLLQRQHAVTIFSHVFLPPLAIGTTWSKVRSSVLNLWLQYWQVYASLVKILMRENLTARWLSFSLTSLSNRITAGSLMEMETPLISRS